MASDEFGSLEEKVALLATLFAPKSEVSVERFQQFDLEAVANVLTVATFGPREVLIDAEDATSEARLVLLAKGVVEVFACPEAEARGVFGRRRTSSGATSGRRSSVDGSTPSKRNSEVGTPSKQRKEKRVAMLKSPCFVGENWLLTGTKPSASVRNSTEEALGYALSSSAFKALTASGNRSML